MRDAAALPEEPTPPTREVLASFIQSHRAQIKAGFRARFASGALRFYDSSDFFATIFRRADLLTSRLDAVASADLRRMLRLIMLEALQETARTALQDRRLKRDLAAAGHHPATPDETTEPGLIRRLNLSGDDLHLARLRSSGMEHSTIATTLGMSVGAVRMRWHRLVERLRAGGGPHA